MVNMHNGHIIPTALHIHAKKQPNSTSTSHMTSKYVSKIYRHMKLGIYVMYAKYFTFIYTDICAYMCHI